MSYLVVRLDNDAPHCPKVKHMTLGEATDEAARLAEKHPGSCFVCAEIICAYQTHPVPRRIEEPDVPLRTKASFSG